MRNKIVFCCIIFTMLVAVPVFGTSLVVEDDVIYSYNQHNLYYEDEIDYCQ